MGRPWARLNPSPFIFSAGCSETPRRAMEQHIYVNSSAQILRALSAFPRPIGGTFTSGQATPRYGEPGTEAPTGQAREHAQARSDPSRAERCVQSRSLPLAAPTAIGEGVCPRPGDAQGRTGKSNTVPSEPESRQLSFRVTGKPNTVTPFALPIGESATYKKRPGRRGRIGTASDN